MPASTFYTRMGAASGDDIPIGASVNIAWLANSDPEAAQVARMFSSSPQGGQSFFQPGATVNPQGLVVAPPAEEKEDESWWGTATGWLGEHVGKPIMTALEWGTETTGNIAEAELRRLEQAREEGFGSAAREGLNIVVPFMRLADDDWKDNWDKAVAAEASVSQTAWLLAENRADELGWWDASAHNSVTSGGLDLLDDPNRREARAQYFGDGAAHWTTGVGDALWQLFADPTIALGKVAGGVKAARAALSAEDVAALAARNVDEAVSLTSKQQRAFDALDTLASSFEKADNLSGAVTALGRSKYLRGTSDGGAIAYFMSRAGEGVDDVAERVAARREVLLAGMGDTSALAAVSKRSSTLGVELEKMTARLDTLGADDLLARTDLDDFDAIGQYFSKLNDSELTVKEIAAQLPQVQKEIDAAERVVKVGAPITGALRPVGELASVAGGRDVARVVKQIQNGPFLERISVITGRHLPGTLRLSAEDAPQVFHEAILRARRIIPKGAEYDAARQRLLQLEDDFMAAGVGASAKYPRTRVLAQFNDLVDDVVASKIGLDKEALSTVYNRMRTRRMGELQQIATRAYQAASAGKVAAVHTGDEIVAMSGKAEWVEQLGNPVMRSQIEDWASIIDPVRLDRFAASTFSDGLEGFVRKAVTGPEIAGHNAWEVLDAGLTVGNRLWKFGALLRPFAYFVRAQADEQMRVLSQIGALKYASQALEGARNTMFNLRKIDQDRALILAERMKAHQRIDEVERTLIQAGQDPAELARPMAHRVKSLQSRMEEVQAARSEAESRAVAAQTARLDERISKLPETGRGSVTRAKLVQQRERLDGGAGVRNLARRGEPEFAEVQGQLRQLDDELRELRDQIDTLKNAPRSEVDDLADELITLREAVKTPIEGPNGRWQRLAAGDPARVERVRIKDTVAARHVGQADVMSLSGDLTRGSIKKAYKNTAEFKKAVETLNGEDAVMGILTGTTRGQLDSMRRTGNWDLIPGHRPDWEAAYLRAVNMQVRSDALGRRVLAGQSDDEIFDWFKNDVEGRRYFKDMRATGSESATQVVDRLREHVDALLPDGSAIHAAALSRDVQVDDIAAAWAVPSMRPFVPGELLQEKWQNTLVKLYEHGERTYFKWAASVPETMLARHPFYAARFERHAGDIMAKSGLTDESMLTLQQVNEIRAAAARRARKDVGDYLFDTSKQSRAGHFLRHISPFYGAWEDTMVKWTRIFGEDPSVLAKGWDVIRAPNAGGWVVDQNGNLIGPDGNVRDKDGNVVGTAGIWDGYIIIPLPDWSLPGGKSLQDLTGATDLRIAKNAANVVFQGDPWFLPGPGPVVAVPTNELLVRSFPEAYGDDGNPDNPMQSLLRWILPYGPTAESELEQVLPSWVRAGRDVLTQDSFRVDQVYAQLYQEQVNMERNGQAEPMTDAARLDLIANRVRNWTVLRFMGTQMPMSWTPQSRLQFYKDEYNRYRREYGQDADEKFATDYPDYFDMAISLSVNETGLQATDESWGAIQAYRSDMAQHPEYGWFWAGAANAAGGEFNQGVYQAQLRQEIGPGTNTHFRSRKDPLQAARDANVASGWRQFQQVNTQLRLALEGRGLTSFNQNDAQDLADIKDQFVQQLSSQNPDWAAEYNSGGDPGKVTEFLSIVTEQLSTHQQLRERGDGMAYMQYLEVRGAMQQAMAQRGTSSINAESNQDLRAIWDQFTSGLIQQDMGFEQAWDRVLSKDDLSGDIYGTG